MANNKQNIAAAVITAMIGLVINAIIVYNNKHTHLASVSIAMGQLAFFLCTIVAILLMVIIKPLRPFVNGVWIGTGINLLIGFTMCTTMSG